MTPPSVRSNAGRTSAVHRCRASSSVMRRSACRQPPTSCTRRPRGSPEITRYIMSWSRSRTGNCTVSLRVFTSSTPHTQSVASNSKPSTHPLIVYEYEYGPPSPPSPPWSSSGAGAAAVAAGAAVAVKVREKHRCRFSVGSQRIPSDGSRRSASNSMSIPRSFKYMWRTLLRTRCRSRGGTHGAKRSKIARDSCSAARHRCASRRRRDTALQ